MNVAEARAQSLEARIAKLEENCATLRAALGLILKEALKLNTTEREAEKDGGGSGRTG